MSPSARAGGGEGQGRALEALPPPHTRTFCVVEGGCALLLGVHVTRGQQRGAIGQHEVEQRRVFDAELQLQAGDAGDGVLQGGWGG